MQMMFSAETVSSEYAHSIWLVNEIHPANVLPARALAFAELLASRSAPALAAIKRLVSQGMELPLAAGLELERAAFAERRPPKFIGVAISARGVTSSDGPGAMKPC